MYFHDPTHINLTFSRIFPTLTLMKNFLALGGVYAIRCCPTGEMYIGGTKSSFASRFGCHTQLLRAGKHQSKALQTAYDQYGAGEIEFMPLKAFPPDEVHDREREAIRKLKPTLNPQTTAAPVIFNGREVGLIELSRLTGLSQQMLRSRIARGLKGDDLTAPAYRSKRKQYIRQR